MIATITGPTYVWPQTLPTLDANYPFIPYVLMSSIRNPTSGAFVDDCYNDIQSQINARGSQQVVGTAWLLISASQARLIVHVLGFSNIYSGAAPLAWKTTGNFFS